MKKLFLACAIFFCCAAVSQSHAQSISVNINLNVDKQPAWGPEGYDYAGFYYFPDLNIYFDVNNSLFYYLSGSNWISNAFLPDKYRRYDLYSLYKVVINDSKPWVNNKVHKKNYSQYKGDKTQTPIRYSPDKKYDNSKQNNSSWVNHNRNSQGDHSNQSPQNSQKNSSGNKENNNKNNSNSNKNNNNVNKNQQQSGRK